MLITTALKQGDRTLALTLIHQAHPYQINQRDEDGQTPLHLAVQKHDLMIIEALLVKGAQVNLRANDPCYHEMTPLHYAALTGDWSAANILIQWGADTLALNAQHKNPATIAFQHGFSKVGKLIEQNQKKYTIPQFDVSQNIKQKTLEMRNSSIETLEARKWLSTKAPINNNVVNLAEYRRKKKI